MRIAIVTGHFMPEIGYQEVYLARAYSRLGHEVKVFTSTIISPTGKNVLKGNYKDGEVKDNKYSFSVIRYNPDFQFGAKVFSKRLEKGVSDYRPKLIVMLAVAKVFPLPLLNEDFGYVKKVALFGDSDEYYNRTNGLETIKSFFKSKITDQIKGFLYTKAVKFCDRIVLNIPETENYFHKIISKDFLEAFERKKLPLNLGFDPDEFYFSEEERIVTRKQLGVSDGDVVIITSTRVNRQKKLEHIVDAVSRMHRQRINVHFVLIGFLEDSYASELRNYIQGQEKSEMFHTYGFLGHDEVRRFYSAADIGIWLKAAISILEAMGTGLPIVLEKKDVVSHLLKEGETGWYHNSDNFNDVLNLATIQCQASDTKKRRQNIRKKNELKFSYDRIAKRILEETELEGNKC